MATTLPGIPIVINGGASGRTFDGIGAVSGGGGNSRLLFDYPDPVRKQILDYLFLPGAGAQLQILKVEIGGDMNSTDGAEPSHMHTANDESYDRGYEWWLMSEAKKRNPAIKLYGLSWGAPGWIGGSNADGNRWSPAMVDYIVKWIKGAQSAHGLTIDYIGGSNENGYNKTFYENLRAALTAANLPTKIVAADDNWGVADDMANDATFNAAIDIVGVHYPCGQGDGDPAYLCNSTTGNARGLNKPLWASEHGSQDYNDGAAAMARAINRDYIDGAMTAFINWPLVAAILPGLPFNTTGLILANQPWSGNYSLSKSLWVAAHTTQFVQPGWSYLDNASGRLGVDPTKSATYVTLKSPNNKDYSMILETTVATAAQDLTVTVTGGLSSGPVHVWATNLNSSDANNWFVKQADITPSGGRFAFSAQPGYVYTLSTVDGAKPAAPTISAAANFPGTYSDDFESYTAGHLAHYLSDQDGSFEVAACGAGRAGLCVRQMTPTPPIYWHPRTGYAYPYTIIGDKSLSDYTVSADVLLEQAGNIGLLGRFSGRNYWQIGNIDAYALKVSDTGAWQILRLSSATDAKAAVLASGTTTALGTNKWNTIALSFLGSAITATINGTQVGSATDCAASGPAGLAVGLDTNLWINAQFDNLKITAQTSTPPASPIYRIVNVNSGKAIDVAGSSTADGALIVQSTIATGSQSQRWQQVDTGFCNLMFVNVASGKALDVPALSQTQGTQLDQWKINGGLNQLWKKTAAGGNFTLTSINSGQLIDVNALSTADGAAIIQWPSNGGTNQQWQFVDAP
jgi:O-glycosyl hydrolase